MNEIKPPKKPLIYYYVLVLLIVFAFNSLVMPYIMKAQVKEVDYGKFMSMTTAKQIGRVEITDSEIVFTDKADKTIYKTGIMDDPNRTQRLYDAGATFSKKIVQQNTPLENLLFSCRSRPGLSPPDQQRRKRLGRRWPASFYDRCSRSSS